MVKRVRPAHFNLFIPLSILTHLLLPVCPCITTPVRYAGPFLVVGGVVLNVAAVAALRRNQTPVEFPLAPTTLVREGPFRFSRNPIYLAGILVLCGLALMLGTLGTFLFPILLFILLDRIYVPIEEQQMVLSFGDSYATYRKEVRRWL